MDGTEICRVCRGEGSPDHPLFYPCKCSGSMKYVHQDCLEDWLEHSHKKYCEICNYQFSFSPIYDESAPEKLSPLVFLKAMFKKTFSIDNVYFRIVFAMSFWLIWVPYATHWIWVFFENPSVVIYPGKTEAIIRFIYLAVHYKENEELFKKTVQAMLQRFSRDVFHGQIISVAAILVGLIVLCIKEYADFRRNRIVINNDQPFQQVIQLEEQLIREQQLLDRQRQQIEQQQQQQRQLQEQQLRQQIHDFEMFLNNLEANRLQNEVPHENHNESETSNNEEDNEFESENGNDNKTVSSENDTKIFEEQKDKSADNVSITSKHDSESLISKFDTKIDESSSYKYPENEINENQKDNTVINNKTVDDNDITLLPKKSDDNSNNFDDIQDKLDIVQDIANDKIKDSISEKSSEFDESKQKGKNRIEENIEFLDDNKDNILPDTITDNVMASLNLHDNFEEAKTIELETNDTTNTDNILNKHDDNINPILSEVENENETWKDTANVNNDNMDNEPQEINNEEDNEEQNPENNEIHRENEENRNNENRNENALPNINPINLNNIPFVINNGNNNLNQANFNNLFNNNFNNNNNINLNNLNLNNNNNFNNNNNNNNNNRNNILFNNNINNINIIDNQQENNDGGIVFLELIGIQGPIENLFQNCFMVLIIITGTIAITIWLPSIIGKGGVWILTNILTPTAIWVFGVAMEAIEYLLIFFDNITSPILNPIADLLVYIVTLTSKFFNFGVEVSTIKTETAKETIAKSTVVEEPTLAPYNVTIPEILTEEEKAKLDIENNELNIANFSTYSLLNIFVGYFLIFCATYFYAKRNVYLFVYTQNFKNMLKNWMKYVFLSLKVIFFIFIELAIFPMFCGILIVFCTLPILGPDSTIKSHYEFFINNIWISQFLYWLAGTTFMFQLALYVGTIKEILRPGALWFVSDPNDPQFQPIKEIIEKPVFYQLRKLFNSALMYMALIFGSIGGTVVALQIMGILWMYLFNHGNSYGIGMIWPLNYDYSNSAIQFPADLILYLLLVPFVVNVSNSKVYAKKAIEFWFRKVSHWLRISEYMFKGKFEDEESDSEDEEEEIEMVKDSISLPEVHPDPQNDKIVDLKEDEAGQTDETGQEIPLEDQKKVEKERAPNEPGQTSSTNKTKKGKHSRPYRRLRVPNTDRIKITPGEKILIPMNDGEPLFGRDDETPEEVKTLWTIIYRPDHFKLRIYALVFLHWVTCVALFSFVFAFPLLLGRFVVKIIDSKYYSINNYINPPNTKAIRPDLPLHDGQSMVIGILIVLFIGFNLFCLNKFVDGNMKRTAKLCFVYAKLYIKEKMKKDKLKTLNKDNKEGEEEEQEHAKEDTLEAAAPGREMFINPDLMDNEETINLIKNEQVLPEPRIFLSVVFNWWKKLFINTFDIVLKVSYISIVVLGIIPLLFGCILEGYIISIIRIPLNQSNVFVLSDIWSYGLVTLSIIVSVINIGPQTRYKTIFQSIKNDGFFNFKLKTLHNEVVAPTIKTSILLLIAPLIFAFIVGWVYCHFIAPEPESFEYIRGFEILRFSFISTLSASILIEFWFYLVDVCKKWMDNVKDEEYLIGRKLHNIEEVNETPEAVENK